MKTTEDAHEPLVQMTSITKRFGRVTVLQGVSFEVRAGEVHVLAGENGAGKSTLIKILAGVHTDFDGEIAFQGRVIRPQSPLHANDLGIAVIYQELSLIGPLSVADNLFLGRTPTRAGFVQDAQQRRKARHWLGQLGLAIDVDRPVEEFPIAVQQLVEIAKALSVGAKVIVMDEPTSALNAPEVEKLFRLIEKLTDLGCGIVYISHKMDEIERIADRITVLRDGLYIGTAPASEMPPSELIRWMVGREMRSQFPRHASHLGEDRLCLENFSVYPKTRTAGPTARDVSLSVRSGEILGLSGLQGSGASDLLMGMFGGFGGRTQGDMSLDGRPVHITSPRQAIEAGVAMLTNDRKASGLVLSLPIIANVTLAGLKSFSPGAWLRPARERQSAAGWASALHLHAASLEMEVGWLSGGNQQKVAIAKWLQTKPRLLLLDQPTRGIDIGAKREIYQLMNQWTDQGIAIVLITSEMSELLALCDRITVMHRGEVTLTTTREQATPDRLLAAAMGSVQETQQGGSA